jgi:hydroxymethylpyrimidine pyrophosphatase-like HAD family hydrolase
MPFRTSHPRFDAVICDIDGCLSPESSGPFDVAALAQIAEHNRLAQDRRDRPLLTLCTGRPQPFAEAMARLLGNRTLPLVAENGVWLYDPAANAYELDPAITPAQSTAVRDAAAWLEETYAPRGVAQQPGKAASVSLYHDDTDYLKSLQPEIAAEFARRGWPMKVSMTWLYINCDLVGVDKGTGLDRLLRRSGLTRERCAGVGDTKGDLLIADRVSWFACPANAQDEIKSRADFTAAAPEAQGVVEILGRVMAM